MEAERTPEMMNIILYYLLAVNIATFFLYGIDKYKAKNTNGAYMRLHC